MFCLVLIQVFSKNIPFRLQAQIHTKLVFGRFVFVVQNLEKFSLILFRRKKSLSRSIRQFLRNIKNWNALQALIDVNWWTWRISDCEWLRQTMGLCWKWFLELWEFAEDLVISLRVMQRFREFLLLDKPLNEFSFKLETSKIKNSRKIDLWSDQIYVQTPFLRNSPATV